MWKSIIDKLFCNHKWLSHAKNIYPSLLLNGNRNEQVTEVLICEKCGRIKQITY